MNWYVPRFLARSFALARQDEFESIHKAMQTDLIEQVMRRLATLKP